MIELHLFQELVLLLLQFLVTLVYELDELLGTAEDEPPLVQLILIEAVIEVLEDLVGVEALVHFDLHLLEFSWQIGYVLTDVSELLDVLGRFLEF